MKKSIVLSGLLAIGFMASAQSQGGGNSGGAGGSGNAGQPGTATNPVPEYYVDRLYVNQKVKVGTSSFHVEQNNFPNVGLVESMYSATNPLVINGYTAGQQNQGGIGIQNTIVNPQLANVGIGMFSPEAKLDITISRYQDKPGGVRITIPNTATTNPNPSDNVFEIRKEKADPVSGGSTMETQFIIEDDGQVGIGVPTPDVGTKLHVHNGMIKITGRGAGIGPQIAFGGTPTVAPYGEWAIEYVSTIANKGLNFYKPYASPGASNYIMYIANSGKVSIGLDPNDPNTYNGDYKLYVADGIMTEKLKVALRTSNEWADYVFAPDYKLMPLKDVQTYINENGHLPNVPSADEVAESGIDVAKMDAKLLEKIEELTLYILEQEKRIQQLEAKQTK